MSAAQSLISAADQAFVDAMATTSGLAAAVALVGALIAVAFLPARAGAKDLARTAMPEPVAA